MRVGDSMVHESIIGLCFTGGIVGTTTVAGRPDFPTIEGRAWITGLASERRQWHDRAIAHFAQARTPVQVRQ